MTLSFLGLNLLFISPKKGQFTEPPDKSKTPQPKRRISHPKLQLKINVSNSKSKSKSKSTSLIRSNSKSKTKSNKTRISLSSSPRKYTPIEQDPALSFSMANLCVSSPDSPNKSITASPRKYKQISPSNVSNSHTQFGYKFSKSNGSETSQEDSQSSESDETSSHYSSAGSLLDSLESFDSNYTILQTLTKQRNEAMARMHKLESKLKERDLHFALKFDQFTHTLKQYKSTNNRLRTENARMKNELSALKETFSHKMAELEFDLDNGGDIYAKYYEFEAKFQNLQCEEETRERRPQMHVMPQFGPKELKMESYMYDSDSVHSSSSSVHSQSSAESFHSLPSLKAPNSHVRQLTTIMEHKQIPLGLLMSGKKVSHGSLARSDFSDGLRDEWAKDIARQRSITYL